MSEICIWVGESRTSAFVQTSLLAWADPLVLVLSVRACLSLSQLEAPHGHRLWYIPRAAQDPGDKSCCLNAC